MSFRPDGNRYIEVIIREGEGTKIEKGFCNLNDQRQCFRMLQWLVEKYEFGMPHGNSAGFLIPTKTSFLSPAYKFMQM